MKEMLQPYQDFVAPFNSLLRPLAPSLKGAERLPRAAPAPHPAWPAHGVRPGPCPPAAPQIFQKIMTRLGGPSTTREASAEHRYARFPSIHPMEIAFHGMFPPFHGVFPTEISHGFVIYSGENCLFAPLRERPSQVRRYKPDGYIFPPHAPRRAKAQKHRSHAAFEIRFRAICGGAG